MRHLAAVILLGGCLVPESSTFIKLDENYVAAPSSNDVEIYIDSPPPRRFRVVGTIKLGYVSMEGAEPVLAAKRARKYGCDLVTTQLVGAVADATTPPRPLFHHASWSGSSGGSSGRSGGGYSSGGGGGGYASSSGAAAPRVYYCGIYVEREPAPAAPEVMQSSLI